MSLLRRIVSHRVPAWALVLMLFLGGSFGSSIVYAVGTAPTLKLPLYMSGKNWAGQIYVDESKGYPVPVAKLEMSGQPTRFTEIFPAACPATPDFYAAQFGGDVQDWKSADPVWFFAPDDKQEKDLTIGFGTFYAVPEGQTFEFESATPSANSEKPHIRTNRGYWICVSQ